ncbi:transposase [Trichonephila clavipes]|nr:transposase [Trichonephila clavipes]
MDQKRPEFANRRGVVFHQDNARSNTSVVTRQKLWELGWKVLIHPPYSLDLASSDGHLVFALQNFLSDKKLRSREDCENQLLEFFANKNQDFYERDIMKLPLKLQQIIQQRGAYVTQIEKNPKNLLEDYCGDVPRNFESWSNDEDDTKASIPSPKFHTTPFEPRQI